MGRRCAVEGCASDSNRPEDTGVTFHKVPMHSDIRPKWISLCHIPEDKKTSKVIYICSRHFLRMDFCNFKGRKYMLRQGVLPSVFPWDKSKLEAIKSSVKQETVKAEKVPVKENAEPQSESTEMVIKEEPLEIKEEIIDAATIKQEEEKKDKIKTNSNSSATFAINSKIEVLDNNVWCQAQVVEEDYEENEVLIHFEKSSAKHDEWISIDSPRLRPLQSSLPKKSSSVQYTVGEKCLASWSDARKFPATVTKVLDNDMYEVLFDDGYVKTLKAQRMRKAEGRPLQSSPLFEPIQSSKQERRDKKRKINIAALFGKRQRIDHTEERHKIRSPPIQPMASTSRSAEVFEPWVPQWEGGKPVGIESSIDSNDGTRKSVIVPDPRLPEGWTKHLAQRIHGVSAGKWETIIVSPDNRRFRGRGEVKSYLEETNLMKFNWSMFDFSIHRHRNRKKVEADALRSEQAQIESEEPEEPLETPPAAAQEEEETNKNLLKILLVDDAYQCPIEGCGKTYRKENLAQMHVKHYHPEYTKFLDSTPNVADLAYARTVGESLDKSPGSKPTPVRPSNKTLSLRSSAKVTIPEVESKPQSPVPPKPKDSEILKLLNTKPTEFKKDVEYKLNPDGMQSREENNLKALSGLRPSTGIKTLLPVVRAEKRDQVSSPEPESLTNKLVAKRRRGLLDSLDSPKGNELVESVVVPQEVPPESTQPNNIIIEGGQVIKIVRMKQEEIINCTCGITEEDGLMIQCDLCLCWQHAFCNNIERESQVPEKYVCYICQNPVRQRASKKYYHDQDWLKHGVLATASFHTKDEGVLNKRFEMLKKSHDASGGLLELREFVRALKVKLKIAEDKQHPKLYLWSKPWEKLPLPEKISIKDEEDTKSADGISDDILKSDTSIRSETNDSMLMTMLKKKEELEDSCDSMINAPIVPQPEAPIETDDCRLNLLEHIAHSQTLVEERLIQLEQQIGDIEDAPFYEDDVNYPKMRQTLSMIVRDVGTLRELSHLSTL